MLNRSGPDELAVLCQPLNYRVEKLTASLQTHKAATAAASGNGGINGLESAVVDEDGLSGVGVVPVGANETSSKAATVFVQKWGLSLRKKDESDSWLSHINEKHLR
jgi:hypothetical protein